MDDTVTGHIGALSGGDGVSLIVGTGVACFAMAHDRSAVWAVDGKGFLLGDDGGGFWIGRRGSQPDRARQMGVARRPC